MRQGLHSCGRLVAAIGLMIAGLGISPLQAQDGGGTIAGTILDQVGKPIPGATVAVKTAGYVIFYFLCSLCFHCK